MLGISDNQLVTRIGPGTPMGSFLREYWLPALTSPDLASDGPPSRLRLLGEDLVAFRETGGRVAIVANACPHRGASLFFGRNEEGGLRCVYHGWKFDVEGSCVDMPSEPAESNFKTKVRARAYPCIERSGIVWAYMGTRQEPPPLPDLEVDMQPEPPAVTRILRNCNWLQALEGDIDTSHSEYLHSVARVDISKLTPGTGPYYRHRLREPFRFLTRDTDFGTSYCAYRQAEETTTYLRMAHFLFPFYTMTPTQSAGSSIMVRAWVPVDDEHVLFWSLVAEATPDNSANMRDPQGSEVAFQPDDSGWLGRFRPAQDASNEYMIDRGQQKGATFTGIAHIVMQDTAMTESMGSIFDRSMEHLGATDSMIIRTRRRILNAVKAHETLGTPGPGLQDASVYRTRSGWMFLPNGVDLWEGSEELRTAFTTPRGEREALVALKPD